MMLQRRILITGNRALASSLRCLKPSGGAQSLGAVDNNDRQSFGYAAPHKQRSCFHTSLHQAFSSPFDPDKAAATTTSNDNNNKKIKGKKQRAFVPRKAAVQLTDKARQFFQKLLADPPRPDIIGIQLLYQQSSTGEPRMVFSFRFVTAADLSPMDEGVSLEVLDDGVTPKSPAEAAKDGLPKLYVAADAFLKVLGATVDVDTDKIAPILYDKEGNRMDPNA